jgi:hypothetical protein
MEDPKETQKKVHKDLERGFAVEMHPGDKWRERPIVERPKACVGCAVYPCGRHGEIPDDHECAHRIPYPQEGGHR